MTMAEYFLDASGLKCPLPVLKARRALAGMGEGDTLVVVATDKAAARDFPDFCEAAGHGVTVEFSEVGDQSEPRAQAGAGEITVRIVKGRPGG